MISSLSADLQTTAYNSLGDRRGAVVVLEPSTGRILAMVSKPDFDPNTIAQNWDSLVNDENNSSLLNRATNGAYPPGSTFKVVTALDYFRQKGSLEGYSYLCQGSITVDDHTIQCYNGAVHGQEDFYSAFAHSCNCAFADMGLSLGNSSLRSTAEDLLFNKALTLNSYKTSRFTLDKNSPNALVMQTSIGQGNTCLLYPSVLSDDVKTISKAPGIGKKTAQKMILELKDKLKLEDAFEMKLAHQQEEVAAGASDLRDSRQEAVEALVALGYSSADALRAVRKVPEEVQADDVEAILRAALKNF